MEDSESNYAEEENGDGSYREEMNEGENEEVAVEQEGEEYQEEQENQETEDMGDPSLEEGTGEEFLNASQDEDAENGDGDVPAPESVEIPRSISQSSQISHTSHTSQSSRISSRSQRSEPVEVTPVDPRSQGLILPKSNTASPANSAPPSRQGTPLPVPKHLKGLRKGKDERQGSYAQLLTEKPREKKIDTIDQMKAEISGDGDDDDDDILSLNGSDHTARPVYSRQSYQDIERPGSAGSYDPDNDEYISPEITPREDVISPREMTKEKLLKMLKEVQEEETHLRESNRKYQHQLADYFISQRGDEYALQQQIERVQVGVGIGEDRVVKVYQEVDALAMELKNVQDYYDATMQEMKARLEEKEVKANDVRESFLEFKREIAKASINSKTGKSISMKQILQFEQEELKMDQEVEKVRLKNITLRKQLANLEKGLRQREELKNGLHLIDFEQLKIENQTFTEKIEERNEELAKLRKKITNTVHILSHVKEKLQFVQAQNVKLKDQLTSLDGSVVGRRDTVGTLKHDRDVLRAENVELKQRSGLIGSDDLLRDFEKRRNELNMARDKLKATQKNFATLTDKTAKLKDLQTLSELHLSTDAFDFSTVH